MPNITLSIEDDLLKAGRNYAKKHNTSLNKLIREILRNKVSNNPETGKRKLIQLMENATGNSNRKSWSRDEIYQR